MFSDLSSHCCCGACVGAFLLPLPASNWALVVGAIVIVLVGVGVVGGFVISSAPMVVSAVGEAVGVEVVGDLVVTVGVEDGLEVGLAVGFDVGVSVVARVGP